MKRIMTAFILLASSLLIAASVWEGSAVVAASGELPESGYFVATNSFPRNTVVDIKNLENDKSIRAIVSGSLDSPGLLASLSREAASAIELKPRDIGRVRMTMPADPIAFSRFTEGISSSGDPDRDPKAALAKDAQGFAPAASVVPVAPLVPALATAPAPSIAAAPEAPAAPAPIDAQASPETAPEVSDAPELAEAAESAEAPLIAEATELLESSQAVEVAEATPSAEIVENPVDLDLVELPETERKGVEASVSQLALKPPVEAPIPLESPVPEPELLVVESTPVPQAPQEVSPKSPLVEGTEPPAFTSELSLVPAEARPPELVPSSSLPPEAEISPLAEPSPELVEAPVEVVPELLAPAAIAEVAPTLPAATAPKAPTPVPAVSVAAVPTAVASPPSFKAPLIQDLEKGSYYLQLGAYSKVATVNSELARHEGKYPLAVQSTGSSDKPIYRVLIGPVNLGESGALLQRFKRDGYKDVFIKTAH